MSKPANSKNIWSYKIGDRIEYFSSRNKWLPGVVTARQITQRESGSDIAVLVTLDIGAGEMSVIDRSYIRPEQPESQAPKRKRYAVTCSAAPKRDDGTDAHVGVFDDRAEALEEAVKEANRCVTPGADHRVIEIEVD